MLSKDEFRAIMKKFIEAVETRPVEDRLKAAFDNGTPPFLFRVSSLQMSGLTGGGVGACTAPMYLDGALQAVRCHRTSWLRAH